MARIKKHPGYGALAALCVVTQQLNKNVKQSNIDTAIELEYDSVVLGAYRGMKPYQFQIMSRVLELVERCKKSGWLDVRHSHFFDLTTTPCVYDFYAILTMLNDKGFDISFIADNDELDEYICTVRWGVLPKHVPMGKELYFPRGRQETLARVHKTSLEMLEALLKYPPMFEDAACYSEETRFFIVPTMFGYQFYVHLDVGIYPCTIFDVQWEVVESGLPVNRTMFRNGRGAIEIRNSV